MKIEFATLMGIMVAILGIIVLYAMLIHDMFYGVYRTFGLFHVAVFVALPIILIFIGAGLLIYPEEENYGRKKEG